MKFMVRLALIFYVTTIMFLGVLLALFVMHIIPFESVANILAIIYVDAKMRKIFAVIALILLWKNLIYWRVISGNQQRERTIAFDNPAGRVSISLAAMEDLIRRVISKAPEVKDVRSTIKAGKRGLEIDSRLVLYADVNIPDLTFRLQELVKMKIQETIGLEETVVVRAHVVKIVAEDNKSKRHKNKIDNDPETTLPFHGYRA